VIAIATKLVNALLIIALLANAQALFLGVVEQAVDVVAEHIVLMAVGAIARLHTITAIIVVTG
jgi:hypothetical protein